MMGSVNRSISRYETTAVYAHPEAEVDIVLVHGLNGSPDKTWTASNGVFWPLDLLPASLKGAKANILVYGYNADVYSRKNDRSASDNFIHQHAQTMVTSLTLFRKSEGTFKNSIIWVCHSLGGILAKRALLYSNDLRMTHHEDYRSIYVWTFGMMFLGTPHTGSDVATWGLVLQAMSDAIMPKKFFESESVLLKTLKKDNETLSNINNHFLDIYQRFRIHMAHENHKTDIKGTKYVLFLGAHVSSPRLPADWLLRVLVVDAKSASPQLPGVTYYGVEATHGQMCKFASASAPGYRALSTDIRQWVLDAPALIAVRWDVEGLERATQMHNEIHERMSPFVSQLTAIPPGLLCCSRAFQFLIV
ncbi:Protein SERAC1 [Tolypocladium ophioglossoides CBS 100239]|uniref:Protein SERAC1 n=1 Tax=Tolypocladium ophioglossoides (strain CBS 100239) TaxID=1163406 RepID=A0A0L0N5T6_TOLOC|nr:Protein SERAC1 [Tolypocladium ophioglossoides CBS 100239]